MRRVPTSWAWFAVLSLGLAAGCQSAIERNRFDENPPDDADGSTPGSSSSGGALISSGGSADGVTLDPATAVVIIDTAVTPTVGGTTTYKITSGTADVTADATFILQDPSLGSFDGATFTSIDQLPADTLGKSSAVLVSTPDGRGVGSITVVALRKTGAARDFFFTVPYNEAPSPERDTLTFSTDIKRADVAFSMDTTSSMDDSIDNLKNSLRNTLFSELTDAIPNVGLAVVDFRDSGDSWVVKVRQPITTTLSLAQDAVDAMSAAGGNDLPEASIASMQFILDGQANHNFAAHDNPPDTFGGVDFRNGSVPIVVNITDADWHDPSGNASMSTLKAAYTAANAKFVAVSTSSNETQANELSDATGSNVPPAAFGSGCASGKCCTGVNGAARAPTGPGGSCRLNFLSSGGGGVSSSVVKAISAIAVGSSFDVTAKPTNDPSNANGVDATQFIKAIRAMEEGDEAAGCPAGTAKDSDGDGILDTFVAVKAGTMVCFEVVAAVNTTVAPTSDPQFFNAFIDIFGIPGDLKLDTRSVLFLVPPQKPDIN